MTSLVVSRDDSPRIYYDLMFEQTKVGEVLLTDYGKMIYIWSFNVNEEWQRRGFGRQMMEHIIAMTTKPLRLLVRETNTRAFKLYKLAGFKEVGRTSLIEMERKHVCSKG
jgi:ribosomal protein S18 acetylase RimI-like enzyme